MPRWSQVPLVRQIHLVARSKWARPTTALGNAAVFVVVDCILRTRHDLFSSQVEAKKDSASAQELLAKQVSTYDEAELCKLLLEISLLDSAYHRSSASRDDVLMDAAKRYRVDTEKLQKAEANEFAAKRSKKTVKPKGRRSAA